MGATDNIKSVTVIVKNGAWGWGRKLEPLFETPTLTVLTPMGQTTVACSALAIPFPQLPLHWMAINGQPFGSVPLPVNTTEEPPELVALTV